MNKGDLVTKVAKATGESKSKVNSILDTTLDTVQGAVKKGDRVTLPGFGTFESRKRKARTGRNPQTGAAIKIAATKVPAFKAGAQFKEAVSGKSTKAKKKGRR